MVRDAITDITVEVTWARAAKVWWSLLWRGLLFGGIAGVVVGFITGVILGAVGTSVQMIRGVATWAAVLVAIPIGIWVVRAVLPKSWSDFQITLVPVRRD